jgi:protein disulfide-isomerase
MKLPRCLVLPCLAFVATVSAHAEITWLTDLDQAKAVAAKDKKAILVDFTGSDWCSWCIRLKKEVFEQKDFEAAAQDFVFVELDFPRGKKQDPALKAKNDALAKQFNIQGFPTVLLLNAQGQAFAVTGYEEGGAASYLKSLAKFLKDNNAEGVKKFAAKAAAEAKQAELNEALDAVMGPYLLKKDAVGAEAALVKFIQEKGIAGEAATRMIFFARMGITMETKREDHEAILRLIDAALAKDDKSALAEELKELRVRVAKAREEQVREEQARFQEKQEAALIEACVSVLAPFAITKDSAGAEAALANYIKEKGISGDTAIRVTFHARMAIVMLVRREGPNEVLKLIDATLALGLKPSFADELKELRAQVVRERDQQAGVKK